MAAKVAGEGKTLSATITVDKPNENAETSVVKLTSPLVGEVTGVLTLDATYATSANSPLAIDMQSSAGNLGLLVNTLAEGASLTLAGLTLPDKLNGTPTINATVSGANAGGLIGEACAGATVALPTGVDISALNVAGKNAAGGIIGKATNLTLTVGTDNSGKDASGKSITVKPAGAVGSSSASTYAGGLIGDASFAGEFTVNSGIFDFGGGVALSVSNTSVPPSAGGLFGVLDISNGDVTVSGGSYTSTLQNGTDNNSSARGNYGGLVGKLWGKKSGEALRAFTVQNGAAVSFSVGSSGKLTYAGGLVGYLGEGNGSPNVSAVVISDATVTCATSGYASNNGKYGGAVGVVDTNNVLEVRGLKVETASNATIGGSNGGFAGVVGSSRLGIVKFSGVTDLSDARFAENDHTAQLVYENFNSLIFAAGSGSDGGATAGDIAKWQYKRPTTPVNIDDVYSYGQVIRLGSKLGDNLITINDSHQWSFDSNLVKTGEAFALANINDFAKLAITWQTSGYFSAVEGVTNSNFASQVPSANITLSADINLSGTGLTGLTKDRIPLNINGVDENSHSFTATLNGNGHAISLAVGEPCGMRGDSKIVSDDTSAGNGKIYRHGRLGLFAAINGAAVSDVTIAGSLKFDNGAAIDAGSLAGAIAGGLTLFGATCKTNIACDDTFTNDVNIGGIAGSVSVASTVTFKNNSKAQATITTAGSLNGNSRIGGAIGYVGNYVSTFNVAGLEVGGKIETGNCASNKIAQVGGLIGCITQSTYDKGKIVSSADKYVNITDLSFNSFKMKVGRNGDALKGAGGLLGYSWGKTTVTIGGPSANSDSVYALNTSNDTTVTANDSTEVGGLVYAASGHWIINDYAINLGGASFTANNATTFGVLIARGSTSDSTNGFGAETSYSGLYLEDKAWWGTAYAVDGLSITAPKVEIYDEWLANGVKPKSKLIDNGCNAVVSLHTKGQKLDMSGDPAKDNSYRNRISPDKLPQANGFVRYYYNLDSALDVVTSPEYTNAAAMITPEHLILWAARQYAPEATYSDLTGNKKIIFTNNQIGLDRGDQITIDLTGYSYYPSNPNGANAVTVKNAKIVFCYSQIKAEQKNNKSNALATQHENMHCGLIRTIGGKDLTVTGVTLSGTVGRVKNDTAKGADPESVSGALVLRCAYGSSGTKMSTINIDTLTLDGLQVDGAEDREYAPLLINAITRYVNLDVKNVTTSNYADASGANKTAASSLFGRLGYDKNSDQVIAKFEKISLPSQTDNTIFTHASLLESFGYGSTSTGSADYTFTKADTDVDKVTYGSEIDRKGTEYSGKQLWYYDEATYGTEKGLVTVDNKPANADTPRFGDYLPYVYKGKAAENNVQYHEIKVNQRIPKLVTGCGTYGDPYTIKDATEMNAIANYINNSVALDGWEVTIVADQGRLCTRRSSDCSTNNEVTYVYKQANGTDNKWEKKTGDASTNSSQTLSDETMHRYIQSAYYSIEPAKDNKITVDAASFGGFGNKANPFRGVIVGDLGTSTATIEIENNKGELRGLVPYSYGSVVRDLNINYVNASATITYSAKDTDGVPTSFFGGVIGCILGGDNIIDGVVVNNPNNGSMTYGFTVKGGSHLVPIGGYVGAIAGGGVIFRNMSGTSWRAATSDKSQGLGKGNFKLYDNPYVGRVIDGYAFSEDCTVTVENGDGNYKINQLENKGTSCVTATAASGSTAARVKPTSSQGLLVLSAIINSGAASGGVSLAYEGGTYDTKASYKFGNARYGKVRNATYEHVGNPDSAAEDFMRSIADDQTAPGFAADSSNSPYLVNSYANAVTGSLCASSGVELQLASNEPYNMTSYGRGFTGLSGRYVSNACASSKGVDRDCIVPRIACINGNGATVTVGSKDENKVYGVTEYVDDNYKVAGVGALFSTVSFASTNVGPSVTANDGARVRELTFSNCNVALTYIDTNGNITSGQASNDLIGTGLLAGATANYDKDTCGIYRNVQMKNCTVSGAKSVGGLLGSSGRARRSTSEDRTYMVEFGDRQAPVYLYDCSYTGLIVTGEKYVGGYVGTVASSSGVWTTTAEGVSEKTVGENSTITATGITPYVGGVIGFAKSSHISVNTNIGTTTAVGSSTAVVSGVNVLATGKNTDKYMGTGGLVGRADGGVISMSNVRIGAEDGTESVAIGDGTGANKYIRNAGGLIGEVTSSGNPNKYWFEDCSVKNVHVAGTDQCSGGLIGYYFSNVNITCNNIAIEGATIKAAGAVAYLARLTAAPTSSTSPTQRYPTQRLAEPPMAALRAMDAASSIW